MKSGIKTTEFWITVIGTIISSTVAVVVALQLLSPEQGDAVVGASGEVIKAVVALFVILAPIIGPIFYSNGRAKVKVANGKQ